MEIVKNSSTTRLAFSENRVRHSVVSSVLAAVLAIVVGCGPSEDPAAAKRLKDSGAIVQAYNGQSVGLNTIRQPITAEVAKDIAALGNLKNIDLTASEMNDEIFRTAVGGLNPVSLVLNDTAVTDAGMSAVTGFGRVEALFLRNTAVGDEGLKSFSGLRTITELDLTGTKITSAGLASLTGLSNLKRLILDETAVDDAGMEHLKSISSLAKLEVRNTQVTPAGAKALSKAVAGLVVEQSRPEANPDSTSESELAP